MSIPIGAKVFGYAMDPGDVVDFIGNAQLTLSSGERIAAWTLTMSPEGAALGLSIRDDGGYAPQLLTGEKKLRFWLTVSPSMRQLPDFDDSGVLVSILTTITTNNDPPRTYERTAVVPVRQR